MTKHFKLPDVSSTIRHGKEETLARPPVFACSKEPHQPFLISKAPLDFPDQHGLMLRGIVRTVGAQFDGDRTDIQEVFPIVWSAVIRAFGIASPSLVYEEHGFVPGEIGACHVIFTQSPWRVDQANFDQARDSLISWTAYCFHLLDDVFQWHRISNFARPDKSLMEEIGAEWVSSINEYLENPIDISKSKRGFPNWQYFSSRDKGITVFRMSQRSIEALKRIVSPFHPEVANGERGIVLLANGIPNTISYEIINLGKQVLNLSENEENEHPLILPIDSHCIFIGTRTVVAVQGDFGHAEFQKEREFLFQRRETENRIFYAESTVEWNKPLSAKSLENLCLELVLREPGVVRAKPVGDTNDRDGGRDILIDWHLPEHHHVKINNTSEESNSVSGGVGIKRIIAQVKYRSKTIGKRDVQDLRDTIDHYEADGYLLIAHPRVSSQLFDHLDKLRSQTNFLTEWWDQGDLERKLRQHPDIARRYSDILKISS